VVSDSFDGFNGFFNTVYSKNYDNVYSDYDYNKHYINEAHGDIDNRKYYVPLIKYYRTRWIKMTAKINKNVKFLLRQEFAGHCTAIIKSSNPGWDFQPRYAGQMEFRL
jgi:hypothetical protein